MKTKIIYISGSEVFDVADIRIAFEEVRNALGLEKNTVLFGVPVDSDDAGLTISDKTQTITNEIIEDYIKPLVQEESIIEPIEEEELIEITPVEKPKARKPRKTKAEKEDTVSIKEEANVEEDLEEEIITPKIEEKIIPILSVLSGKRETPKEEDSEDSIVAKIEEPLGEENIISETYTETIIEQEFLSDEIVSTTKVSIGYSSKEKVISTQPEVDIEDIISEEDPEVYREKTLEQLLEKMAPLREDKHFISDIFEDEEPEEKVVFVQETQPEETSIDETLARLASEFVEKQDDIVTDPKGSQAGKIGKLKNILPFKKAKREEPGLMGDLFGWAGIAANDDEFSIPGFFTTSASKK